MLTNGADGSGADDVAIAIIMSAAVVEVSVKAPLRGVSFPQKVLPIKVGNDDLLVAGIERVQLGVGIFLAHVESGEIVLETVVIPIAESADAEVHVIEEKAAKIGVERLQPGAQRD